MPAKFKDEAYYTSLKKTIDAFKPKILSQARGGRARAMLAGLDELPQNPQAPATPKDASKLSNSEYNELSSLLNDITTLDLSYNAQLDKAKNFIDIFKKRKPKPPGFTTAFFVINPNSSNVVHIHNYESNQDAMNYVGIAFDDFITTFNEGIQLAIEKDLVKEFIQVASGVPCFEGRITSIKSWIKKNKVQLIAAQQPHAIEHESIEEAINAAISAYKLQNNLSEDATLYAEDLKEFMEREGYRISGYPNWANNASDSYLVLKNIYYLTLSSKSKGLSALIEWEMNEGSDPKQAWLNEGYLLETSDRDLRLLPVKNQYDDVEVTGNEKCGYHSMRASLAMMFSQFAPPRQGYQSNAVIGKRNPAGLMFDDILLNKIFDAMLKFLPRGAKVGERDVSVESAKQFFQALKQGKYDTDPMLKSMKEALLNAEKVQSIPPMSTAMFSKQGEEFLFSCTDYTNLEEASILYQIAISPGPFVHTFNVANNSAENLLSGQGHWLSITLFKNERGDLSWIGSDSNSNLFDELVMVKKGLAALIKQPQLYAKNAYDNAVGKELTLRSKYINELGQATSGENHAALIKMEDHYFLACQSAYQFMKKCSWLSEENVIKFKSEISQIKKIITFYENHGATKERWVILRDSVAKASPPEKPIEVSPLEKPKKPEIQESHPIPAVVVMTPPPFESRPQITVGLNKAKQDQVIPKPINKLLNLESPEWSEITREMSELTNVSLNSRIAFKQFKSFFSQKSGNLDELRNLLTMERGSDPKFKQLCSKINELLQKNYPTPPPKKINL